MSVAEPKPRNLSTSIALDKERYDVLDEIGRGLGISRSLAVCRLIDLHAGRLLEEIAQRSAPVFELEKWKSRRLSRDLISALAGAVREGSTKADAYRSQEIAPKVGERWEKRGRADREKETPSLYADLVASLERARAEFNIELVQEARRKGDYKTLLKLLDPEQFSEVRRSEVDVRHSFQLVIDWDRLSIEETRALAGLLRKASPLEGESTVTRTARPALEAIPPDVAELVDGEIVEEGDWAEARALDSESTSTREAPPLDESSPVVGPAPPPAAAADSAPIGETARTVAADDIGEL